MKKLFLILMFLPVLSFGATFYVSPSGNDTTGDGSSGNPYKTMDKVWTVASGATTIILKDGTYSYSGMEFDSSMDHGSSWGSPVTIQAENTMDAIVTLNNAFSMTGNINWYTIIDGIVFNYSSEKNLQGDFVKIQNCGFIGGSTSGNVVNFGMGTNDFSPGATNILIEDSFFYGPSAGSGRYQVMVFNSDNIILRRNIGSIEDGWDDGGSQNPSGIFTVYNSENVSVQNNVAIDITGAPDTYQAGFYFVTNTGISHGSDNNEWLGNIAVNSLEWGFLRDGNQSVSGTLVKDFTAIDTRKGGLALGNGSGTHSGTFNRITIVDYTGVDSSGIGVGKFDSGGSVTLTNIIVSGHSGDDFSGVSPSFFDTFNNGGSQSGAGKQTYDPLLNGLDFPTRIEAASNLKSDGSGGGQIGAQIQYRTGTTGTLYGDANYNTLTAIDLFPYPNETKVRTFFCAEYSTGWCAASDSLNVYVNEYFGNTTPYSGGGGEPEPDTPAVFESDTDLTAAGYKCPCLSSVLFGTDFGYEDGLITNEYEYWNPSDPTRVESSYWEMTSGSVFASTGTGWTGVPDDTEPNATSSNGNNSVIFRMVTKKSDFENVTVSFSALHQGFTSSVSTPEVDWDGFHIFLRYQDSATLYYATANRRDDKVVIKKKKTGTYYDLSDYNDYTVTFMEWHRIKATIKTTVGGDVEIKLYIDEVLVASGTDDGTLGGAPITNPGRVGIRGDNSNLNFDDFIVTSFE